MARKPMVTRTLKNTVVVALCMNVDTCEPCNETFTIARTFKDDAQCLKTLKGLFETPTYKVVHIVSREEREELYGMTEDDFIKYSTILDKETRKVIGVSESTDVEEVEQEEEEEEEE